MKNRLLNNIGLKLLALVSAIVIWIVVVSINDPVADKTYRDVTVKILNEDIVTSEGKTYQIENGTGKVNVSIHAQRSVLSKLRTDDIEVTADMKEMTLSSMIPIKVTVNGYEGRYQRATTNPLNVQVSIEDIVSNKFPVTVSTSGTLRDGFVLAGADVTPQTVTITGPETVIRSIDHVEARVSLSGISSDTEIDSDLVLINASGEEIDQSRLTNNIGDEGVEVRISVNPAKEVPIEILSDRITTPSGYYLADVSYEPTSVSVTADEKALSRVEKIVIPASAFNLKNVTSKTEATLKLGEYLPDGVRLTDSEDEKIVVTLRVARLGQKVYEYPVGSIVVDNLADNLQLAYEKKDDLEITVQGPQSELDSLTLSKGISVNMSKYNKPGIYTVPVTVELPDTCTAQPAQVTVKLTKKGE